MTIDSFSLQTTFCRRFYAGKCFGRLSILHSAIRTALQGVHFSSLLEWQYSIATGLQVVKLAGSVTVNPWGQIPVRRLASIHRWTDESNYPYRVTLLPFIWNCCDYYLCWVNDRCRLTLRFKCRHSHATKEDRSSSMRWVDVERDRSSRYN